MWLQLTLIWYTPNIFLTNFLPPPKPILVSWRRFKNYLYCILTSLASLAFSHFRLKTLQKKRPIMMTSQSLGPIYFSTVYAHALFRPLGAAAVLVLEEGLHKTVHHTGIKSEIT